MLSGSDITFYVFTLCRNDGSETSDVSAIIVRRGDYDNRLKTLLLITGPAGSLALLIIIISVIALCYILKRERQGRHNDTMRTDTTSVNFSRNPSLTTMLTFDSKIYTDEG